MKKLVTPEVEKEKVVPYAKPTEQKIAEPIKPQIPETSAEPKKPSEYTEDELPKEMRAVGLGMYKDMAGNVWDYRIGPDGKRLYSIRQRSE
jgi:hypothetical protein